MNRPYSKSNRAYESKFVIKLPELWKIRSQKNSLPGTEGTAVRGLRRNYPSIRILRAGNGISTVIIDTIDYITEMAHYTSTEYAYRKGQV